MNIKGLLIIYFTGSALGLYAQNAQPQNLKLWYTQPAQKWTDALPIGNGRLGAMIYGGVQEEHIQFNEETLWTGGPRDYQREGAVQYLQPIRKLLQEGKQAEAEELAEKHFMGRKSNEEDYEELKNKWLNKVRSNTAPATPGFNDKGWKEMQIPTSNGWEEAGLEGEDGAIWFRNYFELPDSWAGKNIVIELGRIRDVDITYINGKQVGTAEGISTKRRYTINASVLRKGRNEIAIQVINFYDKGGLIGVKGNQKTFILYPEGGRINEGIELKPTWRYWIQDSNPPIFPQYEASYQPFGDVWMTFNNQKEISDYRRQLDLTNAISSVSYKSEGVVYSREYFSSAPYQAIVMHFSANKPGKLDFKAGLGSPHKLSSIYKVDDRTIALVLKVSNGVLKGVSYLRAETSKGQINISGNSIEVRGADDVTFYLTAATSFKNYKDVSGNPDLNCRQALAGLKNKNYEGVKAASIKDYKKYFNTFSIDLGHSDAENLPTDERIVKFKNSTDPALLALYVQYGRYLLISSSRPGTQAANLQGIWNNLLTPPWGSKYTTNINLEMNYWPAEVLNLTSCNEPLFNLIKDVSVAGSQTAKAHYGAPGWVLHHNTDIWRGTAPINASNHGIWVTGGAWLCHHLWEHYLFTGDENFLKNQAYPIMKQAAEFFVSFLVKDPKTGWLISTPSNSPEHGGLVAGPTMDHQIIRDLFKNVITASELLKSHDAFRKTLQKKYEQIAPNQIGKLGQLQEWLEDKEDTTEKHRHVSHLWGVYPGTDITWDSVSVMKAARQSLLYRGDEGTGWSIAWKVNLWARFRDGDHALLMMDKLLSPAEGASGSERGGVYHNMFDAHPPFQIDGNFGGAAGLLEMLVQSQGKGIELLPALPTSLPNGTISGLCARGGFVINMQWEKGILKQAEILSKNGNDCLLYYGNKEVKLKTQKDKVYRFDGGLSVVSNQL